MSQNLEIYCLTKLRNAETIDRFLDRYIDRNGNEDRGDERLMMLKLDAQPNTAGCYEWELAITLSQAIERGLDYPPRCFAVYLKSKQTELRGVTLSFTIDNQLILGLCIDDVSTPENLEKAKELLSLLGEDFSGHRGLIVVEQPPPESEEIFQRIRVDSDRLCLYSCGWDK